MLYPQAEWLLLSLLMQECEVCGPDVATATLNTHLSAYPNRPSALRLALYCYRTFLPKPVWKQTQLLKVYFHMVPNGIVQPRDKDELMLQSNFGDDIAPLPRICLYSIQIRKLGRIYLCSFIVF